jgi:hypothetical protein
MNRTTLDTRYQQLYSERSSWISHWQDLSDYILPRRGRFLSTDRNKGHKRYNKIIDNTGTLSARTLASGLMAGVTSPARPWFRLSFDDPELSKFTPVKEWLFSVEALMREVFAKSNLYNSLHAGYSELGTFGTMSLFVEQDFDDVIRCFPFTTGSYCLATDSKLRVDTMYREFDMTVRQIVDKFGNNASSSTMGLYKSGDFDSWVTVRHAVQPNKDKLPGFIDKQNKPIQSVYWEKGADGDKLLSSSGFEEMPVMCPRWEVTGTDIYGNSPGMAVLGDVKQLQQEQKDKSIGIEKMVKPPMVAPSSIENSAATTLPGGVTFLDNMNGGTFAPAYMVQPRINELMQDIRETQNRIKRGYYEDLFLMLANSDRRQITAREIDERHEEKLLMLGPVLERLHDELLDPLIDRTFSIMSRAGILPPAPQEIQDRELNVEYISMMAQAQKAIGTAGLERFSGYVGNLAAVKQDALDNLDADEAIKIYADMLGIPPKVITSQDDIDVIREARANQAKQQAQIDMLERAAQGASTLSDIDTNTDQTQVLGL